MYLPCTYTGKMEKLSTTNKLKKGKKTYIFDIRKRKSKKIHYTEFAETLLSEKKRRRC